MKKYTLNTAFGLGFWFGVLLFIGVNYYDFVTSYEGWDDFGTFGIPFTFSDGGKLFEDIIWIGLIGDILFALVISSVFGMISKYIWSKISPPRLF